MKELAELTNKELFYQLREVSYEIGYAAAEGDIENHKMYIDKRKRLEKELLKRLGVDEDVK